MNRKSSSLSIEQVSRIAMLSALCVVLRYAFSSLPNIQPVTAIFLTVAITMGFTKSILVMSTTMLVSSFLLGFGPWVFWQIITFSLVLLLWKWGFYPLVKLLHLSTRIELASCSIIAGALAILYGMVIDSCFAFLYHMPWWTYVLNGMSFNLAHAVSTGFFYPFILFIFRRLQNEKII